MPDIVIPKFTDSEISKAADFALAAEAILEILNSVVDGAFEDVSNSFAGDHLLQIKASYEVK